jgi:hypothetical protein
MHNIVFLIFACIYQFLKQAILYILDQYYNIQPPLDNNNVIDIKYMVCCIIALKQMENSMSLQHV